MTSVNDLTYTTQVKAFSMPFAKVHRYFFVFCRPAFLILFILHIHHIISTSLSFEIFELSNDGIGSPHSMWSDR